MEAIMSENPTDVLNEFDRYLMAGTVDHNKADQFLTHEDRLCLLDSSWRSILQMRILHSLGQDTLFSLQKYLSKKYSLQMVNIGIHDRKIHELESNMLFYNWMWGGFKRSNNTDMAYYFEPIRLFMNPCDDAAILSKKSTFTKVFFKYTVGEYGLKRVIELTKLVHKLDKYNIGFAIREHQYKVRLGEHLPEPGID